MEHRIDTAKQQQDRPHSPLAAGPKTPIAEPPLYPLLQLQRGAGNQTVLGLLRSGAIHAKLKIGSIDDPAEREADDIADRVMRMPAGGLPIRRKCEACEEAATAPETTAAVRPPSLAPATPRGGQWRAAGRYAQSAVGCWQVRVRYLRLLRDRHQVYNS
jgi:hypothetical protein